MPDLAHLIPLAIKASICLMVLALGLKTQKGDGVHLLSRPGLLVRSLLAMNVAMVLVALAIARLFALPFPVELCIVALALSPVPPILPGKQQKAGGSSAYAISLLLIAALVSIVTTPLAVGLVEGAVGRGAPVSRSGVAGIVFVTVIVPLLAGILVRFIRPDLAVRAARPVSLAATVLLVLAVIPVLFTATETIWTFVGDGVALALAGFSLVGLALGHVLGGPDPAQRTVLALATGTRHPGVAMAIAHTAFPDEQGILAILLYHLVIGAVVSLPYVRWSRARAAHEGGMP